MEKLNQNREPSPEDKDFWAEFAGGVEKTEQPPEQPANPTIPMESVKRAVRATRKPCIDDRDFDFT